MRPRFCALSIILSRSGGGSSAKLNLSTTPPVKSVSASDVSPPLRASYEPFNLRAQGKVEKAKLNVSFYSTK